MLKLFACGILAAMVACSGLTARAGTPPDTLVEAWVIDDLVSLDPAEIFEASSTEYLAQVYDRLIGYDQKDASKLVPLLAESWTVSDDARTYTFRIRDGVTFHSGNPLTARDAAWSLQRAIKLNLAPAYIVGQLGLTPDTVDRMVTAPDDRTLVIGTDKAYAPTFVLNCLTATVTAVVDSKLVQEHEANGDFGHDWLKTHSAGSGPFKLASWKPNELLSLDRNDGYWQGQPGFRRVFIRHVPESSSRLLLLQKGDVDVARNLTPDQLKSLQGNADITLEPVQKMSIFYVSFNVLHAPFDKPEVRQALKSLVDYDGIVATIMHGLATVHQTLVPAGMLGAIDDAPFKLDVDKAKALLAQAGLPDGFKATMDVINQSPYIDIAQALQASFARAGVTLELIPGDARQVLSKQRAREHEIYIGRWGPDYEDPDSNAGTFAVNADNSDATASKTQAWANGWQDAAMTADAQGAVLETDGAKRAQIYADLQRRHQQISPFAFMFQLSEVIASRKSVAGLTWSATYDRNQYWTGRKS